MKVSELFEAQGDKLSGNATHAPGYRAFSKTLVGSTKDWLKAMNVTDQDIVKAMARVRGSGLFRNELPKAGLDYAPSEGREKLGTFNFSVDRKLPNGKKYSTNYQIHANGQIRSSWERGWGAGGEYTTKLVSPKPRMKAGDPVGSLVMIYTASLEELLAKWKKSTEKMDKAAAKEVK
jgi:hypothetical protein